MTALITHTNEILAIVLSTLWVPQESKVTSLNLLKIVKGSIRHFYVMPYTLRNRASNRRILSNGKT